MSVDRHLANRLEQAHAWRGVHYADAQRTLQPQSQSAVLAVAGGQAIFAGADSPVNRVTGLGMSEPVAHADMDAVEEFYRNRHVAVRVDVCPLAHPSLLQLLAERGYKLEEFLNVLFCPLPVELPTVPMPAGIQIGPANRSDGDLWIRTVAQGFAETEDPAARDLAILGPNFSENATCFFAWVDGVPAGGGGMYIHDRVAEFGGASTRVMFRRRGVQTALLYHRLKAAHDAGCDLTMVLTEPGSDSQRNVERVGFRLAYTKVILTR
jgi:GNAT superfamily N-acetyltransferase